MRWIKHAYFQNTSPGQIKLKAEELMQLEIVPEQNESKGLNCCPPHIIVDITHLYKRKQEVKRMVQTPNYSATFRVSSHASDLI